MTSLCEAGSGLDCEIRAGVTAIVGDSGAGKSTLLNLLVEFERPDSGEIRCHIGPAAGQLKVFWIPPGNGLWSHLSVRQHLEIVQPSVANSPDLIDQLLGQFNLQGLARALPDDLSQGEQARLAMTRALASRAAVLVLDEPLVHTSLLRQPAYWRVVREHCAQHSTSLVLASHDLETISREAGQVIALDRGQLVYSGPLEAMESPLPT
jgi:ABC-type multidrug transport system ATPase subunit